MLISHVISTQACASLIIQVAVHIVPYIEEVSCGKTLIEKLRKIYTYGFFPCIWLRIGSLDLLLIPRYYAVLVSFSRIKDSCLCLHSLLGI